MAKKQAELGDVLTQTRITETFVRMAAKVDCQNACDLVFKGLAQPSGCTEPLLHAWWLKVKAAA